MSNSILQELAEFGQSVWLDYINRPMLENGELKTRIKNGLRGMTSNPSIFNQAIGSTNDYDEAIVKLKAEGKETFEIYDELTIKDIQDAADCFQEVYESTNGLDGYVSLEINPLLANDVDGQIDEGLRLFKKVNRKNVMIKVPSTEAGITVVEELISQGVNVNVTLIFSLDQYMQTAFAYIKGIQRLADSGGDITKVRSVASVFVSRIDTAVDALLDEMLANETDDDHAQNFKKLKGKAAVANCRVVFEKYKEVFNGNDFKSLAEQGAHVQRVLWGSTSTKSAEYSDIKYVTELITHPTVNTIPEKTLNAFIDHGQVKEAFDYDVHEATDILDALHKCGIDINHVCQELLQDGCIAFNDAFNSLQETLAQKAQSLSKV